MNFFYSTPGFIQFLIRKYILFQVIFIAFLINDFTGAIAQSTFYRNFYGPQQPGTPIISGACINTSDGDYVFGLTDSTVAFQRTDSNGVIRWTSRFDFLNFGHWTPVQALTETQDGGFLAAITTRFDTNFPAAVLKFDSIGTFEWVKEIHFTEEICFYKVIVSSDSAFIFCGRVEETGGSHDMFVLKCNFSGDILWNKAYQVPGDEFINEVMQKNSGELLIIGRDLAYVSGYITSLSLSGTTQFMKSYPLNTNPSFVLEKFHNGQAGRFLFSGTYILNPGMITNVVRFVMGDMDSTLSVLSAKSYSFTGNNAFVYEQTNGNVMVLLSVRAPQSIQSSSLFHPTSMLMSSTLIPLNFRTSIFFACDVYFKDNIRLSDTRFLQSFHVVDHFMNSPYETNYSQVRKYSTTYTQCNNAFFYTMTDSVINWPAISIIGFQEYSLNSWAVAGTDFGVPPLVNIGSSCVPVGIEDGLSGLQKVEINPNPVNAEIVISLIDQISVASISVFNAHGVKVKSLGKINAGTRHATFNVSDLPVGIYFVDIIEAGSNQNQRRKFIKY